MDGNWAGKLSACNNRMDAKIVDGNTERSLTTPNTHEVVTEHGSTIEDPGARGVTLHLNLEQIANHMLYLELLAKSMSSQDELAIEWSLWYLSRCIADVRAKGIPAPWAWRVEAIMREVRVCINGAIAAVDDKGEVPNGLVQLADAPSQMPGVQTKAIMSIMRQLFYGTVFVLHDIVKYATDLRATAQQVAAQDFFSKVMAAFASMGSEAEAAIVALQSPGHICQSRLHQSFRKGLAASTSPWRGASPREGD